jgi:quinoprotein glucose dehydrogenase
VNWGSAAFDPVHQILYANTTYAIHVVKLIPRAQANGMKPEPGVDFGPQIGAPFAIKRVVALSKVGMFCTSRHGARWSRST